MKIFDAAHQAIAEHRVFYSFTEGRWLCPHCPLWRGFSQDGADIHVAEMVDSLVD